MMLADKLFAILIALPPWHGDVKEVDRHDRLRIIADSVAVGAIEATCDDGQKEDCKRTWPGSSYEVGSLATDLGWWESRYAKHVHEGRCRLKIGECDAVRLSNGIYVALAQSPWQLQQSGLVPGKIWRKINKADRESTGMAAKAAIHVLGVARASCGAHRPGWEARTVARYATGKHCAWKGAANRVRHWKKVSGLP